MVIGEALVDLVPSSSDHLSVHLGGGPFNTARALARLGQPVSFLGSISDDALRRRLRSALAAEGVALETVITTSLPTTLAFADLDDAAVASYRFYTEGTAAPALTPPAALAALPSRLDALVFGSLGLVLEPLATAVTGVVREAAAARAALTVMDPNIRASLIADCDEYLERFAQVLEWTDVVKASAEDLAWLGIGAAELLDRGPRLVLLTRGAGGATVFSAAGTVSIPAPRVKGRRHDRRGRRVHGRLSGVVARPRVGPRAVGRPRPGDRRRPVRLRGRDPDRRAGGCRPAPAGPPPAGHRPRLIRHSPPQRGVMAIHSRFARAFCHSRNGNGRVADRSRVT